MGVDHTEEGLSDELDQQGRVSGNERSGRGHVLDARQGGDRDNVDPSLSFFFTRNSRQGERQKIISSQSLTMLVLQETPAGFALFSVADKKIQQAEKVRRVADCASKTSTASEALAV